MSAVYYQELFGDEAIQEVAKMLPGPAREELIIQKISLAIKETLFLRASEFAALMESREARMVQLAKIGQSKAVLEVQAMVQFERDGSFLSRHSQ